MENSHLSKTMSKMNREPPKNVYCNNRLKKIAPATDHNARPQLSRQQHTSAFAFANNSVIGNKPLDPKVDRSLHFNKSQTKYQKHFEPNSPTKPLASKRLNEGPGVRQSLLNLKHPSHPGDLGIPLSHSYVQRKFPNNTQPHHQPTEKKPRKNFDYLEQQSSSFGVKRDRLHSETPSFWSSFQDSPKQMPNEGSRNDPTGESEHVQRYMTGLAETFEEVVKDNPEFVTVASSAKEELLKRLRSYAKRQHEQEVDDHIDDMDEVISESAVSLPEQLKDSYRVPFDSLSNRSQDSSIFSGESVEPKIPLPFNKMTPNFVVAAHSSVAPAAHRFKSNFTPREFLTRSQQELGMSSKGNDQLASDAVSSKGSLEGNLSISQSRYKDYSEEKNESFDSRPSMSNRDTQPYYFSLSHFRDNSNRPY